MRRSSCRCDAAIARAWTVLAGEPARRPERALREADDDLDELAARCVPGALGRACEERERGEQQEHETPKHAVSLASPREDGVNLAATLSLRADVAELVDAHGSGPCARKGVEVQVLSSALMSARSSLTPLCAVHDAVGRSIASRAAASASPASLADVGRRPVVLFRLRTRAARPSGSPNAGRAPIEICGRRCPGVALSPAP